MRISKQLRDKMDSANIVVSRTMKNKIDRVLASNKDKNNFFSRNERIILYLIIQGLKKEFKPEQTETRYKNEILSELQGELEKKAINEKLISLSKLKNV